MVDGSQAPSQVFYIRARVGVDARSRSRERSYMRFHNALAPAALLVTLAACSDAAAPVDPIDPPGRSTSIATSGRVFTLSGSVPAGARLVVTASGSRATAPIAADGTFSIQTVAKGDTIDFVVEAAGMHPSLVRILAGAPLPRLQFVLVPRRWTVRGGSYDGTSVDISLDAAFRPPCSTAGDTNCDGFYPTTWTGTPRLWPRAALPIRVAFDHPRAHQSVSAADSAEFWRIVGRMNTDYGAEVFRPARIDEITIGTNDRPQQAIVVRVDTTLASYGAWTNWWWNGAGEMYSAVIRPRRASYVRSASLMTHELLHTQGFKHSCSWTTVMGGYGCTSHIGLSATDVAYAQLATQVEIVQRQSGATHGLAAARDGERVIALNLPPIAASSTSRSVALSAMNGDSIGDQFGDHAHRPLSRRSRH